MTKAALKKRGKALAIAAAVLAGAPIGWFLDKARPQPVDTSLAPVENRENDPAYRFINPILFTETDQRLYPEFDGLDAAVSVYAAGATSRQQADSISVYFRDMNTGHWTGFNEDEKYEPSSMLKTVLLIAYLRMADKEASQSAGTIQSVLSQKLYYPGTDAPGQYYRPVDDPAPGFYPIQKLLEFMVKDSDNAAMNALINFNYDEYQDVWRDYRLPLPPSGEATDYMTAKSFSVIWRTLYNSTYLPWNLSEEALRLLSETDFDKGLVAGVPASTTVSHKFGEHTYVRPDGSLIGHELHDCGIIYYPGKPYLLCVMTKGQDFPQLESVVSDLSKLVWDYVSKAGS